jgi:putative PIN family toxin of toxin-antitoxin system
MSAFVVIDTNVLISAQISKTGIPNIIWTMVLDGTISLLCSTEIIAEYIDVLSREKFASVISEENRIQIMNFIESSCKMLIPDRSTIEMPDEDDRVFYDVAKTGDVILITGNKKHYPATPWILSPAEFVHS